MAAIRKLPEDVINHTFKCHTKWQEPSSKFTLNLHETGVIEGLSSAGKQVKVALKGRFNSPRAWVPITKIAIGPKYGSWKIVHNTPRDEPQVWSIEKAISGVDLLPDSDIRVHLAPLLTGLSEQRMKIASLSVEQAMLLQDEASVRQSCNNVRAAMISAAPNLPRLLCSKHFTIWEVANVCTELNGNQNGAGVYIRIYYEFRKGSALEGEVYIYIGQAENFNTRMNLHKYDMDNPSSANYNLKHYQIGRQAQKCKSFILCKHQSNEGGSSQAGKVRRDLMEQVMMLLFNTYRKEALMNNWEDTNEVSERSVVLAVAEQYASKKLSTIFTQIADLAAAKSGFARGTKRASFGVAGGLNYSSPFGGEAQVAYEKTLYARQEIGDYICFHRTATVLDNRSCIFEKNFRTVDGTKSSMQPRVLPTDQADGMAPQVGEKFYAIWEIRKDGDAHEAPYFRVCDLGMYSNWTDANKLGLKIIWYSKRDKKWYGRYLQRTTDMLVHDPENAQGALNRYKQGAALYAYFVRSWYPNAQPWFPILGISDQIQVNVDGFQQNVVISVVDAPLRSLQGPIPANGSLDVVALRMEELGFENVNGDWRDFGDKSWLDSDPYTGDMSVTPKERLSRKRTAIDRRHCDRCAMMHDQNRVGRGAGCGQVGNSNRCGNCVMAGLPCSWSRVRKFSQDTNAYFVKTTGNHGTADLKTMNGPFFRKAMKALLRQPENTDVTSTRFEIRGDVAFDKIAGTQAAEEADN
ncbi:hypothetical protein LTR37_008850 [Vermiconidia calcicola]|uniref:Uncharacterized protein n=1 Tax=Vermiconidia calcicola TaxID=1690605 RepID=A0ACC3N9V2_9PEZI|nr:hypothetical protein LTR37_008850 [Vermiconidia calcicola]